MKHLILLLSLSLFSSIAICQETKDSKGFGYVGGSVFGAKDYSTVGGIVIGGGIIADKHLALGGGIDVMMFTKGDKFAQLFGDLRIMADGKSPVSPFITLQPGYILYNNTKKVGTVEIKTTGGFAFNALVGVAYRPQKGLGLFFNVGYSNIGFKVVDEISTVDGIKFGVGIAF